MKDKKTRKLEYNHSLKSNDQNSTENLRNHSRRKQNQVFFDLAKI